MRDTATTSKLMDDSDRFPSLSALRTEHSKLLKLYRQKNDEFDILTEIEQLIQKGQATGAVLDNESDRWSAQSLLDYWLSLLYRAGRELPDATLSDFDPSLAPDLSDDLCPYLGLEAFQEKDQNLFFGRQRLVDKLLEHLKTNRLLIVVGSSGSGKSSAVLGGLLPRLRAGEIPNSQSWIYYKPLVPDSNPLAALAWRIKPVDIDAKKWIPNQIKSFHNNPNHLVEMVDKSEGQPCVLVIDQFEEVFTLCRDDFVRETFFRNLLNFVQSPGIRHVLVLTVRTDFESQFVRVPSFLELFKESHIRVTAMDAGELRETIEKPAEKVGLKFEEGLVDKLLGDVLGEPAALPLLQFTLLKLWKKRNHNCVTWDEYQRLGGGRLALAKSADEFYVNLIPEEQLTAKRILLKMVRPSEGLEFTSNRIRCEEIYRTGEANDRIDRVLNKLIEANVVHLTKKGGTRNSDLIEVVHEALVRNWPRFVEWLEQERSTKRRRLRLTDTAEDWLRRKKDRSLLLRGALLDEALQYEDLNKLEVEFVNRSKKLKKSKIRLLISVIVSTFILLSSLTILAWKQKSVVEKQKSIVESQKRQLETQNKNLQLLQYSSSSEAYFAANKEFDSLIEILKAGEQLEKESDTFSSPSEKLYVKALQQSVYNTREFNRLEKNQAGISALNFSSDGEMIASGSLDGYIWIWEKDGSLYQDKALRHSYDVTSIAFSPISQNLLLSSDEKGIIKLWKLDQSEFIETYTINTKVKIRSIIFHPTEDNVFASADENGTIKIWKITKEGFSEEESWKGHQFYISKIRFSPDGKLLASASNDGYIKIWENSNEVQRFSRQEGGIRSISFSPDGQVIASAGGDQSAKLWTLDGKEIKTLKGHSEPILDVEFNPDGRTLTTVGDDGTVKRWSKRGALLETFYGHTGYVSDVAISPDGKIIASGGSDKIIRLWQNDGPLLSVLSGHTDTVLSLDFNNSGRRLISGGADNLIKLWSIDEEGRFSEQSEQSFEAQQGLVWDISFHPTNDNIVASVGRWFSGANRTIRPMSRVALWNIDGTLQHSYLPGKDDTRDIEFSHDGNLLIVPINWDDNSKPNEVKVLDGSSLASRQSFAMHDDLINSISTDSKGMIASASDDRVVKLIDTTKKFSVVQILEHDNQVKRVTFSSDSKLIAVATVDGQITIWKFGNNSFYRLHSWSAHEAEILSLSFNPEKSQVLVSGGADEKLKFWHIDDNNQALLRTINTLGAVNSISFSPDGNTLASSSSDGDYVIKIWDANTFLSVEALLEKACSLLGDYLSNNANANSDVKNFCKNL